MKTRMLSLDRLVPDARNARRHDARNINAIKTNLQAFNQYRPIVVQKSTMRIVVGNGMLEAMKELGWTHADVLELDLTDAEATKLALADNRSAELATWDETTLAELLGDLRASGDDATSTGFDEAEIDHLLAGLSDASKGDSAAAEGARTQTTPAESDVCVQVGAYRWRMPVPVYDAWIETVKIDAGFDYPSVCATLQTRLGLDPEKMENLR